MLDPEGYNQDGGNSTAAFVAGANVRACTKKGAPGLVTSSFTDRILSRLALDC
jgi:hypothetical protein